MSKIINPITSGGRIIKTGSMTIDECNANEHIIPIVCHFVGTSGGVSGASRNDYVTMTYGDTQLFSTKCQTNYVYLDNVFNLYVGDSSQDKAQLNINYPVSGTFNLIDLTVIAWVEV